MENILSSKSEMGFHPQTPEIFSLLFFLPYLDLPPLMEDRVCIVKCVFPYFFLDFPCTQIVLWFLKQANIGTLGSPPDDCSSMFWVIARYRWSLFLSLLIYPQVFVSRWFIVLLTRSRPEDPKHLLPSLQGRISRSDSKHPHRNFVLPPLNRRSFEPPANSESSLRFERL